MFASVIETGRLPHHHRTKTLAPGWQVTRDEQGSTTWTTPTGHSYESQPHDYRDQLPKPQPPPPD